MLTRNWFCPPTDSDLHASDFYDNYFWSTYSYSDSDIDPQWAFIKILNMKDEEEVEKAGWEETVETCHKALEYYNSSRKGEEYVMVRPRCSTCFAGDPFLMYHCNFWAKKPDDASASLFFAELCDGKMAEVSEKLPLDVNKKGELRVLKCQKLDGAFNPDEIGVAPLFRPDDAVREDCQIG